MSNEKPEGVFEAMGQGFNPDLEVEKLQQTTRELIQKQDVDKMEECDTCGRWGPVKAGLCEPCEAYWQPKELK